MAEEALSPTLEPLLRALGADPRPDELGGLAAPLAQYRAAFPSSGPSARTKWRPSMLSSLLGAKLGATVAGVAVGLGGAAVTVAYAGSQHPGAKDLAQVVVSAPAASPTSRPNATKTKNGVGPDAKGAAAFGLCNAWSHHQANGAKTHGNSKNSVAFRNLAAAAGGEQKIAAYCAKIPHPSSSDATDDPEDKDKPTTHPTGKPTTHPTGSATAHPTGSATPSTSGSSATTSTAAPSSTAGPSTTEEP